MGFCYEIWNVNMKQQVRFNYADVPTISLQKKKEIQSFVTKIFEKEKKALNQINYVFCSDEYLLTVNQSFLQHDDYTDIITFDLSEDDGTVGEIYISVDRVKENAQTLQNDFRSEMLRVIFHGALHLCGYKDKKKSEITLMRGKEDHYLLCFEKLYL